MESAWGRKPFNQLVKLLWLRRISFAPRSRPLDPLLLLAGETEKNALGYPLLISSVNPLSAAVYDVDSILCLPLQVGLHGQGQQASLRHERLFSICIRFTPISSSLHMA
jgi:hypothetical protein